MVCFLEEVGRLFSQFIETILSRKRWMILTTALVLGFLATLAYIIYIENTSKTKKSESQLIIDTYGNVFYTDEQIYNMNNTKVGRVVKPNTENKVCSFSCTAPSANPPHYDSHHWQTAKENSTVHGQGSAESGTGTVNGTSRYDNGTDETMHNETIPRLGRVVLVQQIKYHGCCASRTLVVAPDTGTTAYGVEVKVVQFKSMSQIYVMEECRQVSQCSGCACAREENRFQAVVVDIHDRTDNINDHPSFRSSRMETLIVPGYCKCFND